MRTLYLSDLDGTLLRPEARTSAFTNETLNRMIGEGLLFSYATARSIVSASKVTEGLNAAFPVITYNGAFVVDAQSRAPIMTQGFNADESAFLRQAMEDAGVFPIVYAFVDGRERYTLRMDRLNEGLKLFQSRRPWDPRTREAYDGDALFRGEIFYFTMIDEMEKLESLHERLKDDYHCILQIDLYDKTPWLEVLPKGVTKASAAMKLKEKLGCDRIVAFGDGKNDVELFEIADEAYAVGNAVDELKAVATGIIESNDRDGVAKWLAVHGEISTH